MSNLIKNAYRYAQTCKEKFEGSQVSDILNEAANRLEQLEAVVISQAILIEQQANAITNAEFEVENVQSDLIDDLVVGLGHALGGEYGSVHKKIALKHYQKFAKHPYYREDAIESLEKNAERFFAQATANPKS